MNRIGGGHESTGRYTSSRTRSRVGMARARACRHPCYNSDVVSVVGACCRRGFTPPAHASIAAARNNDRGSDVSLKSCPTSQIMIPPQPAFLAARTFSRMVSGPLKNHSPASSPPPACAALGYSVAMSSYVFHSPWIQKTSTPRVHVITVVSTTFDKKTKAQELHTWDG